MKTKKQHRRELFSSHIGMLLACVGSAMGLANIWMFPARLGEFGGITFLIPYLIFLFGFSCFGLMGEYAFGKKFRKGPVQAFEQVFVEKNMPQFGVIGWFPVLSLIGVLAAYSVIMGWILKYLVLAITNSFVAMDAPAVFNSFAGTAANIPWTLLTILVTAIIVSLGIQKGIERYSTIMMATFYIVVFFIVIRALTLPNALQGVIHMFTPNWQVFFKMRVWIYALGMAFFTLSLGGAAMVVYGSYMPEETDVPKTARQTAGLDLLASVMCALFTIPAAFSFGFDPGVGPGLLFISIPNIVTRLPAGYIFGILFFLCALFAALTSSIVMLEVPIEALMSKFRISRKNAAILMSVLAAAIAVPLNFSMSVFGRFTDIVTIIIFPLAAVTGGFVIFWVYGAEKCRVDMNQTAKREIKKWFSPYMKYVYVPVCLLVVIMGILFGGL
ncbi:sodium-dependent transporter [Treponema phagedenis]|uniref:Transporter n=1 Tax=Treponema phagedenis TaxID=162 RepID=A0A0B7GYP1_TREPH|nr:sodium-dependent transporter [Treponema phagedenis]EFW38846.1 Sodium:neurotransmitter symporter family protein [Treponema phagedenis F0421]NVP23431.1 sodium-dependent transporter [Treponema phagedenis]QEJ95648.1 sodium-dependent transporter [Treponema phagedenis]QEK01504.1 sodium-dependent transporter [Treponema phagedenis]QEK06524.1 sodium-dependent transporter [Treponema phagedenis]